MSTAVWRLLSQCVKWQPIYRLFYNCYRYIIIPGNIHIVITVWLTLLRVTVFMSRDKTHLLAVMRCRAYEVWLASGYVETY